MRTLTFLAMLLVIVFVVGCSEQTAPTEVSEDMPADGADRLYKGKPIILEDVPFGPFTFINPCTGLPHDNFGTFDLRIHEFILNENGDHHFNVHWRFDVETSDGYSGFVVQEYVDNGKGVAGSPDEEYSSSTVFNVKLSNEAGQRIIQHSNFHITIRNGEVVSFVLNSDGAKCEGVPDN